MRKIARRTAFQPGLEGLDLRIAPSSVGLATDTTSDTAFVGPYLPPGAGGTPTSPQGPTTPPSTPSPTAPATPQ